MSLKRNEKAIYAIEIILFGALVAFGIFCFSANAIFKNYYLVVLLWLLLCVAIRLLGRKKDKNFMRFSMLRTVVSFCLLFGLISYSLGIILNFNRSYASLDPAKIAASALPAALIIVASELLRRQIARSYTRSRAPIVIYIVLMVLMTVLANINAQTFSSTEAIFLAICGVLLPAIATELLCSYLCMRFAMSSALCFKLIASLYVYVIPIVPNLGTYISTVIHLVICFAIYYAGVRLQDVYDKDQRRFRRFSFSVVTVPLFVLSMILVVLVSGLGYHQIIAIGSNSMSPLYARGDAVLLEKCGADNIEKGDILVFRRNGITVTHRVVQISDETGERHFYTRGDANEKNDEGYVLDKDVIGRVQLYTKYIGYPTLWVYGILNGE